MSDRITLSGDVTRVAVAVRRKLEKSVRASPTNDVFTEDDSAANFLVQDKWTGTIYKIRVTRYA